MDKEDVSPFEDLNRLENAAKNRATQSAMEILLVHYVVMKLSEGVSPEEISRQIVSREVNLLEIDFRFALTIASSFSDPTNDAITKENYEVASVLSGIQIEHIMNMFLNDVLEYKYSFSDSEITQILNAINLPAKMSWFLTVTTDYKISDKLREKVLRLVSLRNRIAHFKSLSFKKDLFSEEDISLLSNSSVIISELEQELSGIWFNAFPEYEEALSILKEIAGELDN